MTRIGRIADLISSDFISLAEVQPTSRLEQDLGLDSLDRVELVMMIEERFGVWIPDGDADGWETVADIDRYLEERGVPG